MKGFWTKANKHKVKVLVVSTSRHTHGGITEVLKLYEKSTIWTKYNCRWIGTSCNYNNILNKVWWIIKALSQYIVLLPFYDIVHIHFSLHNSAKRKFPFFILAKLYHKKIVIHLHCGSQIDNIWSYVYNIMFKQCNCSIVLSENLKTKIEEHIGTNKKIRVVYNPCPIIEYTTKYEKQDLILFSGRLQEGKGYKDLIKAFAKIAQKHPDWRLVMAGNGDTKQAYSLAFDLGISKQVALPGWIEGESKHKIYSEAKVLCLPSYAEGFPVAILEACAYGLPIITTPVGGIPDVAIDNVNMLLFNPPGNIELLSQCLDLIISDTNLREKLAKEAKYLADTKFNINTIVNQIGDIYEELK